MLPLFFGNTVFYYTFLSFSAQFEQSVNLIVIFWGPEQPGRKWFFFYWIICASFECHLFGTCIQGTHLCVSLQSNAIYALFGSHRGGQRAPFIYTLSQWPLSSMLRVPPSSFSHPRLLLCCPAGCNPSPFDPHSWPLDWFPRHTFLYGPRYGNSEAIAVTVTDG